MSHLIKPDRPRQILIPIDFSAVSSVALSYGVRLARRVGGQLSLLHVIETVGLTAAPGSAAPIIQRQHEEQVRRMLPALLPLEQHEEFYLRTYVKAGDIVEEVLMALEEEPPDFVIMGRHGRGLIAHALIGSVAQGVLSSARVPVITVGPVMDTPAFDTVVLAMDFDERSRNKVQFVSQMARDLHAELVLSHALDVELEGGAEAAVYMSESRIEEARARITELIASVPGASPKISVRVAERSIADTILQDAYEQSADLIAVGLENPDEAGRLSFASTIPGRVIRDAHVPVVLIPANLRLARDTGVKKAA